MIIKSNLASKPTRNFNLYFLGCILLTLFAAAFTFYNIRSLLSVFEENSALRQKIAAQDKVRADYEKEAAALRARIASIKTPQFVKETEFLNNAIKRRVFSWTLLFDSLEKVFPNNVRMLSVNPSITEDDIGISMEVVGKNLNDIVELIRQLQSSPAFSNIVFRSERQELDGSLRATISLKYRPERVSADDVRSEEHTSELQSLRHLVCSLLLE